MRKSGLSFNNVHSFLKQVDSLYTRLAWICETIDIKGDVEGKDGALKRETVELW